MPVGDPILGGIGYSWFTIELDTSPEVGEYHLEQAGEYQALPRRTPVPLPGDGTGYVNRGDQAVLTKYHLTQAGSYDVVVRKHLEQRGNYVVRRRLVVFAEFASIKHNHQEIQASVFLSTTMKQVRKDDEDIISII